MSDQITGHPAQIHNFLDDIALHFHNNNRFPRTFGPVSRTDLFHSLRLVIAEEAERAAFSTAQLPELVDRVIEAKFVYDPSKHNEPEFNGQKASARNALLDGVQEAIDRMGKVSSVTHEGRTAEAPQRDIPL